PGGARASCPQLSAVLIRGDQARAARILATFKSRISPAIYCDQDGRVPEWTAGILPAIVSSADP
ncbi:MAG: hypothetical protein EBZ48_13665, partial [Proteobacteria bacterium]|nr:hypothetical protein [Pseudomonadota bacterium]